jgi:hypothetical protein
MKSLFLLTFALAPAALLAQPQQCILQNAVLNGAYVGTTTGTAGSPAWAPFKGPVATMGRYVFDGSLCSNRSTRESFLPKFSLSISWDQPDEERPSEHQP